ncbi:hypothetical protein [Brachyspira intermedia]|uniref:hypothetical protein n=1 Tax=Brachyspira intermedia TaxID=84377 RepID=UPI0030067E46
MIKLNVDEIEGYGITEQPIEYNSEEELIKWLKYDLLQQVKSKIENKDKKIITIRDEEEKDYTLNIGRTDFIFECDFIEVNFIFIFDNIVSSFYSDIITNIYFIINCNGLIFKKYASFSRFDQKTFAKCEGYNFYSQVDLSFCKFKSKLNLFNCTLNNKLKLEYNDIMRNYIYMNYIYLIYWICHIVIFMMMYIYAIIILLVK